MESISPSIKNLSVVIPVYNSQETLDELSARLKSALDVLGIEYEVVLVNDGSRDKSWETICRLAQQYPFIRGVNLMRNYGQHNALLCGIRQATNDVIITIDDDLQHPPEEIHKVLEALTDDVDVVYGVPNKLPHSWWRNQTSILTKRILAYVMGVKYMRNNSSFRAFRSRLRKAFEHYQNPNVLIDVLLSWGTARFVTVGVDEAPRASGQSNYDLIRLIQVGLTMLTGFSTAPLRFTSMLGFFFTFLGLCIFIYILAVYFLLGSIPGFPFLASIISLFSGMQLFALGIIGEYLARVFDRSIDRPTYVIGEVAGETEETGQASQGARL